MKKINPYYSAMLLSALLGAGPSYRNARPTGGQRRSGYEKTPADHYRLYAAAERRKARALKRFDNHGECIGRNPCLRNA